MEEATRSTVEEHRASSALALLNMSARELVCIINAVGELSDYESSLIRVSENIWHVITIGNIEVYELSRDMCMSTICLETGDTKSYKHIPCRYIDRYIKYKSLYKERR